MLRRIIILIAFLLPFIIGSSNRMTSEEDEKFYLSNYTTFAPKTNIFVNLYQYGERSKLFQFRLLRIDDPLNFFTMIDQNSSRYAFDIWGKDKQVLLRFTSEVKTWNRRIYPRDHRNANIDVGKIDKPGIYVLQAIAGKQVAYCGIVVTNYSLIYKNTGKEILAFVADANTGEFSKNASLDFYQAGKIISQKKVDKDGLAYFDLTEEKEAIKNSNFQMFAITDDELILSDPYLYFNQHTQSNLIAYVYTNQPVYRPAQKVHFKAILRERKGNELNNIQSEIFGITVKSPKNKEVYSDSLRTNQFGTLSGELILEKEADLGTYQIILNRNGTQYYGSFDVEEYKKPEYLVTVTTEKNQYSFGDKISGTVKADYYFGSPVTNATVNLNIYKKQYWRPWWWWSEYSWYYRGFYKDVYWGYSNQQLVQQISGSLNDEGEFSFDYKVPSEKDGDYVYTLSAEVTDASRRAITGSGQAFVTRGAFTISTSPDRYFYEKGIDIKLRINASDFSDKPVETKIKIEIEYPYDNKYQRAIANEIIDGKTDKFGKALINFTPKPNLQGRYRYKVYAYDEKEREIIAENSFFVGDREYYYHSRTSGGIEIVTDKDSYDKGDSLIAYIFLPHEDQELLLTFETDRLLKYKKINSKESNFEIREKLTDIHSPGFHISITYMNQRNLYSQTKMIGVLAKDKFLNVKLSPSKDTYKPGETALYDILVTDYKGNPLKDTELSFGVIDESIYAIKDESTPEIQNFFYSPQHYYVPTHNSLQYGYFSSNSRAATFIDLNYFDKPDKFGQKGSAGLYGAVKIKDTDRYAKDVFIILSSEKNYYSTKTDKDGKYHFKNIAKGEYEIYVSVPGGVMTFIKKHKIVKDEKFDFEIDQSATTDFDRVGGQGIVAEESLFSANDQAAPSAMRMSMKSVESEGRREKKDEKYVEAEVRSNFVDAVIWKAHIVTDSRGEAKVEFKIPDNLTTWRATARGITKETEVGQQISKVISRKDLLVRMETPRFLRMGDELVISTIVHNYLSEKKKTKISFDSGILELLSSEINQSGIEKSKGKLNKFTYEIVIPENSELRIDWKIKVTKPVGDAILKVEALTNEESDAMQMTVPIIPNGIKVLSPLVADYSENSVDETLTFSLPNDIDLRTAELSFAVSPSLAGTMLKALDDLAGYPYGCVEQTMSRFLPTIIVANTLKEIKAPLKSKTIDELPDYVDAGLKRLYNFQHSDGGWGWWTNDNTHPYMTAYVIYGLSLAKKAGYAIDQNIYYSGINNLKGQIEKATDIDETTLSYMIYSLSTALGNDKSAKSIYAEMIKILLRKELNAYPISLLGLAANNFGEIDLAKQAVKQLKDLVNDEKGFAYWGGEQWHYRWQNDNVQGTAFAVKALINIEGNSELVSKAVRWMLRKKQGYSWRSTQETSVVIFALTDYLKKTNELEPSYNIKVIVNGKESFSEYMDSRNIYSEAKKITIDNSLLKKGNNEVKIIKRGNGKVYFSGLSTYFTEDYKNIPANSFTIKREYFVLKPIKKEGRIIYRKEKFTGIVTTGEDIFVKTSVESKFDDMEYFILEDMLPSGFEVVKDIQNYEIEGENQYGSQYDKSHGRHYRPWIWHYADREYRDEKVAFFVTNVSQSMEFTYIMKAQIPGEYLVMPSQGYLMYYPELAGYSKDLKIKVKDLK